MICRDKHTKQVQRDGKTFSVLTGKTVLAARRGATVADVRDALLPYRDYEEVRWEYDSLRNRDARGEY